MKLFGQYIHSFFLNIYFKHECIGKNQEKSYKMKKSKYLLNFSIRQKRRWLTHTFRSKIGICIQFHVTISKIVDGNCTNGDFRGKSPNIPFLAFLTFCRIFVSWDTLAGIFTHFITILSTGWPQISKCAVLYIHFICIYQ